MRELVIFGAGPFASLIRRIAENDLGMRVVAFCVDEPYRFSDAFESLPLLTPEALQRSYPADRASMFVAVGYRSMRSREAVYNVARHAGYKLVNLICPSSYVSKDVALGDNNIVMPHAVLESGVRIADNNVIWSNATICHDTTIGSHNFIAANATIGGGVAVGDRNFLGFSSVVLQRRRVGNDTLVGAQALVRADTEDLAQYQGLPARKVRGLDPGAGVMVTDV